MTTKQAALEALKRAHDAVASLNESGAYRDIVNDLRTALCVLDARPEPINVYVVVKDGAAPHNRLGACYESRREAEAHVSSWPRAEGLRIAHLVEVQTLVEAEKEVA